MERFTAALPDDTSRWPRDCAAIGGIGKALDRYIDAGPDLHRRLAEQEGGSRKRSLSLFLQDSLYDKRGLTAGKFAVHRKGDPE